MIFIVLRRLALAALLALAATAAAAQSAPEDAPAPDPLAEAIRAAGEAGARVVVIDPDGSASRPDDPPPDATDAPARS